MTATGLTLPDLRAIDLFDDLSDEQLGEWAAVAGVRDAAAGGHGHATPGGATTPGSTAPSDKSPASPHDAHVDHGAHGGRK